MKKAILVLATALVAMMPLSASAAIRGGFVTVGPGFYASGWGPGWYGPSPYWSGYWGRGPYYAYPLAGEVKLDTKVKDAQVFINGAYAGTTKDNKTMHLRPGSYNIEIREGAQTPFAQKVYVTAGKTIHLQPAL